MDDEQWQGVAAQDMMCILTDNPRRFQQSPWRQLYEQAEQTRRGPGYGGRDYLTCPF